MTIYAKALKRGGTKRVRRKPDNRNFSFKNGDYGVAESLRPHVTQAASMPYRTDSAERLHKACVLLLRTYAGPIVSAMRKSFFCTGEWLVKKLGISRHRAETTLIYLEETGFIERVPGEMREICPYEPYERPDEQDTANLEKVPPGKHKNKDGEWRNDAIQWRFSKSMRKAIWKLHAHKRQKAKSDICKFYDLKGNNKNPTGKSRDGILEEELTIQMTDFGDQPWLYVKKHLFRPKPPSPILTQGNPADTSTKVERSLGIFGNCFRKIEPQRSPWRRMCRRLGPTPP